MAKFLNTIGLSDWMARIINETERELVIISPYLQLSDKIFSKLLEADKRGVETILIYRENQLKDHEKRKLLAIENLNLMHHPNIHAKCMYNENFLLIGSMNLYEYSEKNNREMGVLFHKINLPELGSDAWGNKHDDLIFKDALEEIIEIKNAAEMERPSRETIEEGFELEILKNEKEKREEYVRLMNSVFIHKKFVVDGDKGYLCKSYMDKVDVLCQYRIEFFMKFDEAKLNSVFNAYKYKMKELEFSVEGFKMYWNSPDCILLYDDSRHYFWKKINSDIEEIKLRKKGIDEVIQLIKSF